MLFPIPKPPWQATVISYTHVIFITTLYLQLINPYFVHALGADSIDQEDHNHPRLLELLRQPDHLGEVGIDQIEVENYEPEFAGFSRSIIGRVSSGVKILGNNAPARSADLKQGDSQHHKFPKEVLLEPLSPSTTPLPFEEGSRILTQSSTPSDQSTNNRGPPKNLYVTLTTCDQPFLKKPNLGGVAKQLELYISTNPDNPKPNKDQNTYHNSTKQGFLAVNLSASSDIFFTVTAPSDDNFDGFYTYELTASIDAPYAAAYNNSNTDFFDPNKHFFFSIDSDSNSTLLAANLTTISGPEHQEWIDNAPPYSVFVHDAQDDPSFSGIQSSLCGLKLKAQFRVNLLDGKDDGETSIVTSSRGQKIQQFYVKGHGLNASSSYYAILAVDGNSTKAGSGVVRGGGTVGTPVMLKTKSDRNCALLFNLPFCSEVAYAVPSNPNLENQTSLTSFYDDHAKALYQNFTYSLQQIPCNTTATAQYSLARTCDDCAAAYKSWLCAVTIPRCDDFSTPIHGSEWLQPRNIGQSLYNGSTPSPVINDPALMDPHKVNASWATSSRSQRIDNTIKPGPWKEILPCQDLCYDLVQSCPAALGFACPLAGKGLEISYGSHQSGNLTCNYPGEPWFSSKATSVKMANPLGMAIATATTSVLLAMGFAL